MRRVIIATGGRKYMNRDLVFRALDRIWPDLVIVGDATGADKLVADWCYIRKVDHMVCHARWNETTPRGKAGPDRNERMGFYAGILDDGDLRPWSYTACLHFPGGTGTANMMAVAEHHGFDMLDGLEVADLHRDTELPWDGRKMDLPRRNPEWQTWDT